MKNSRCRRLAAFTGWGAERALCRAAGFPTGGTFLREGDRVMRHTVVDQVSILCTWKNAQPEELALAKALQFVRRLELQYPRGWNEELSRVLKSPFLGLLEGLELNSVGRGEGAVGALVESGLLGQLRSLALESNELGPEGALALAEALGPNVAVQSLEIIGNSLGNAGALVIARSPRQPAIRWLALTRDKVDSDGARDWQRAADWSKLESLDLDFNPIGDLGALVLAESPTLGGLKSLGLQGAGIGATGAAHLANSPLLSKLESLDLSRNRLFEAGGRALLESTGLQSLRSLGLVEARVPPATVALLRQRFPQVDA